MSDNEKAPSCPISHSQDPSNPRGTAPTRLPAIPIATDLPSLIRSVNIMRDILRTLTTSLTVNNTYLPRSPRQPKVYGDRNYLISPYPDWYQVSVDNTSGYVGRSTKARTNVERLNTVVFRNNERDDDNLFKWNYKVPLTGEGSGGNNAPFEEDYFERIVRVHWKKKKEEPPPPGEFYDEMILNFTAVAASYWDSEYIEGLGWVGTKGKLAGGSTDYGAEIKARNELYYVYGQPVIATGFTEYNEEFDTDHMPFNPPGGPQILTASGGTTVTLTCHDTVYGYGSSGTITFGTIKFYPYSTSGIAQPSGVEYTYTCQGMVDWYYFAEPWGIVMRVLFIGRETSRPPPEPEPPEEGGGGEDGEDGEDSGGEIGG